MKPAPGITEALRRKGENTLIVDANLARAPIFAASPLGLFTEPSLLYGDPVIVAGDRLAFKDLGFIVHLCTEWVRAGCPEDRRVPISVAAVARWRGLSGAPGGKGGAQVRKALVRLTQLHVSSTVALGRAREHATWGVLAGWAVGREEDSGWVELDPELAERLRAGRVTWLHKPTFEALMESDPLAARLWVCLETEHYPKLWRYRVFAGAEGTPNSRSLPPIKELVGSVNADPGSVVERISEACRTISKHHPAYQLSVEPGVKKLTWNLCVNYRAQVAGGSTVGTSTSNAEEFELPRPGSPRDADRVPETRYGGSPEPADRESEAWFHEWADGVPSNGPSGPPSNSPSYLPSVSPSGATASAADSAPVPFFWEGDWYEMSGDRVDLIGWLEQAGWHPGEIADMKGWPPFETMPPEMVRDAIHWARTEVLKEPGDRQFPPTNWANYIGDPFGSLATADADQTA